VLTMTDNAAMIIREITVGYEATTGLRITLNSADGALDVSVTSGPGAGDRVVREDGAQVFVSEEAAEPLDGRTLDASIDETDGTVTFTVTERHR
jgi:iron-sulfur cluster assembly protein